MKVFHHNSYAGAFPDIESTLNMNPEDEDANLFSILDQVENYRRRSGVFHFRLCYPNVNDLCNEWTQTSNPVTDQVIENFKAIDIIWPHANHPFAGLGLSTFFPTKNLMDSSPSSTKWRYSIGATELVGNNGNALEGPKFNTHKVVLYLKRGEFQL